MPGAGSIKVISLWQPWHRVILDGPKRVENRSWALKGPFPRWLAIHACAKMDKESLSFIQEHWQEHWPEGDLSYDKPGIYGFIRVSEVTSPKKRDGDVWAFGPYCWVIDSAVKLDRPFECKGRQGLWTLPDGVTLPYLNLNLNI